MTFLLLLHVDVNIPSQDRVLKALPEILSGYEGRDIQPDVNLEKWNFQVSSLGEYETRAWDVTVGHFPFRLFTRHPRRLDKVLPCFLFFFLAQARLKRKRKPQQNILFFFWISFPSITFLLNDMRACARVIACVCGSWVNGSCSRMFDLDAWRMKRIYFQLSVTLLMNISFRNF